MTILKTEAALGVELLYCVNKKIVFNDLEYDTPNPKLPLWFRIKEYYRNMTKPHWVLKSIYPEVYD